MENSEPFSYSVCLSVKEGRGFGFVNKPLVVGASLCGTQLFTEPVPSSENPFINGRLAWSVSESLLRKLKISKTPIRVEFFFHPISNKKNRFGYILVNVKEAFDITKGQEAVYSSHQLQGLSNLAKTHSPSVKLYISIEDYREEDSTTEALARKESITSNDKFLEFSVNSCDITDSEEKSPHVCLAPAGELTDHFILSFELLGVENLKALVPSVCGAAKPEEIRLLFSVVLNKCAFRDISGVKSISKSKKLLVNVHSKLHYLADYFSKFSSTELKLLYGEQYIGKCLLYTKDLLPKGDPEDFVKRCDTEKAVFIKKKLPIKPTDNFVCPSKSDSCIELLVKLQMIGTSPNPLPEKCSFTHPVESSQPSRLNSQGKFDPRQNEKQKQALMRKGVAKTESKLPEHKVSSPEVSSKENIQELRRKTLVDHDSPQERTCEYESAVPGPPLSSNESRQFERVQHSSSDDALSYNKSTKKINKPNMKRSTSFMRVNPSKEFYRKRTKSASSVSSSHVPQDLSIPCDHHCHPVKDRVDLQGDVPCPLFDDLPTGFNLAESLTHHKEAVRSKFHKICIELEDWKEKQQDIFRYQLKKKTERYMQKLSHEWLKRQKAIEDDLSKRMERCMMLTNNLSIASDDLAARTQIVLSKEKELNNIKAELDWQYTAKFQELREASRRQKLDMDHKISIVEAEKEELRKKLDKSEIEKAQLIRALNEPKKTPLSVEQTARMMVEMKSLEEKLESALEAKAYFKEEWGKAVREIHQLKEEQYQNIQREIQRNKLEVQRLGLVAYISQQEQEKKIDQQIYQELKNQVGLLSAQQTSPSYRIPLDLYCLNSCALGAKKS